ncbi:MAG: glycosyltransferase [Bacteroidetes bacterium]|nr:glycosyltransferase [Bacteroidota bacterium]
MNKGQVFQTDSETRWKSFKWTTRILLFLLLFFTTVCILAIMNDKNPPLPGLDERARAYQDKLDPSNRLTIPNKQNKKYAGFKSYLEKKVAEDSLKKIKEKAIKSPLVRAAFYVPWDPSSLRDLRLNGDKLNTIYPEWFFIDTLTYRLQTRIDTAGLAVMRQNKLSIQPILNNFHSNRFNPTKGFFDPVLCHVLFTDAAHRENIIRQLADTLRYYNLQGINIDFEALKEETNEPLVSFQQQLYEALHKENFLVSMDVEAKNEDYDYAQLEKYNDHMVLMAYDQYSSGTGAGPISGQKWIEELLDWMDDKVDVQKIILGVAGYGRDWTNSSGTNDLTYPKLIDQAKLANATIDFDNDSYNLHYTYVEAPTDSSNEIKHNIWFTDAATTFNVLRFSDDYATSGTALWRLGSEDPRIWKFYGRDLSKQALQLHPFDFNSISTLPYDQNAKPTAIGEGELLKIIFTPSKGKVKIETDSADLLIAEQQYLQLPSGYVYEKFAEDTVPLGKPGHKIILTFDDGPDAVYTPQIISILKKEKIPATFFIVGINAEQNIPMLKALYNSGYEIGNHTFTHSNFARMSLDRAEFEMKTTRALLECVTGHSTILFRAPYNADSEPQTFDEIEPLARSKKDNYISVGESIDPNDWDPNMNADSIVNRTIRIAEAHNASIILLHDAGGVSRKATVEALPRIIDYFKKRGCTFSTVAGLMGKTKDDVMPAVKQDWQNKFNFYFVEATYWTGQVLFSLFLIGILLSVGRMIAMATLAYMRKRKEHKEAAAVHQPGVSIIVPAYNEEVNAIRTVESLLKQIYPDLEIVFVDDGSKDNTYHLVAAHFAGNPKVKVVTKTNGGKATALNYGISLASNEFVVCIDADTQLQQDAVAELMKKFNAPDVAAVAGNVKVGNEVNMITRWQSIEYITSQNFDRRAFDLLNCITVVPGAIGAFKKAAILEAGGFTSDTLAEDCDLTMRLHRAGYVIKNCTTAISFTEAPETMKQFLKQRFRWSFGVMQCFWKHRDAVFNPRYKNFGMIALPNILVYQVLLPFLAPLADLVLVLSLVAASLGIMPASIEHILIFYLVFTVVDIAGAAIAFTYEKADYKKLFWMLPQRLIYRQLMYYILIKSFNSALKGELQGWGALKRTGNVKLVTSS